MSAEPPSTPSPLGAETERDIVDAALRAVAESASGFDEGVLAKIETALRPHVSFETLAVSVEEPDGLGFRIFWQGSKPAPLPQGALIAVDAIAEGIAADAARAIVEDTAAHSSPIAIAFSAAGLRSYAGVAIPGKLGRVGWLGLSHKEPGAPSRAYFATLDAIARIIGPSVECARHLSQVRALASLVESSQDGMLALDHSRVVREANRASLAIFGKTREEVIGRRLRDLVGEHGEHACELSLQANPSRRSVPFELSTAGDAIPLDLTATPLEGNPEASLQIVLRDARPRRAAEMATARRVEQLAFLRALGETIGADLHALTAVERGLDVCFSRPQLGAMGAFRVDGDKLRLVSSRGLGMRTRSLLAECTHAELSDFVARHSARSSSWGVMTVGEGGATPDDSSASSRWMVAVPLVQAKRALGALLIVGTPGAELTDGERDLWEAAGATFSTALHSVEDFERVVALEAEKRQLVDNLPAIVARVDPTARATLFVNAAVERVLGVSAAQLTGGEGLASLLVDDIERRASESAIALALSGQSTPWEERRYRHRDGRVLSLREHVHPVRDADASVRCVEIIAYDVTTEIESRKRLMQSDRLASLGALAAGIAHEINNPVAFIGLAAGHLDRFVQRAAGGRDPDAATRAHELAKEIGEAADRIATIVGELKLFTRVPPSGTVVTPVDVNRIVQMALTLTGANLRRRASVEVELGELPLVPGEFTNLGQAFVNLLINAAQAIEEADKRPRHMVRVTSSLEGDRIVVRVRDTGVGIPPELLPRIFEPFFTTRASGGAGLGLSITYDLVRRVGGDIHVTSEPGEGSTFEVILPAVVADAERRDVSLGPAPGAAVRKPRVLIIDDEAALARALARQLAERYEVETVLSAHEARSRLEQSPFDVVVCDLGIPDEPGPAIYEAVLARSPEQAAKFVFTTGGDPDHRDTVRKRAQQTGLPILEKPFDSQLFERLVERIARSSPPPPLAAPS